MASQRGMKVSVSDGIGAALTEFKKQLGRPTGHKVGQQILSIVRESIAYNFHQKVDSFGLPWDPLAETTRLDREMGGYPSSDPRLIRTRKLFDSATKNLNIRIHKNSYVITPGRSDALTMKKWIMHNRPTGDVIGINTGDGNVIKIPGREFFFLTNNQKNLIMDIVMTSAMINMSAAARHTASLRRRVVGGMSSASASTKRTANKYSRRKSWFKIRTAGTVK